MVVRVEVRLANEGAGRADGIAELAQFVGREAGAVLQHQARGDFLAEVSPPHRLVGADVVRSSSGCCTKPSFPCRPGGARSTRQFDADAVPALRQHLHRVAVPGGVVGLEELPGRLRLVGDDEADIAANKISISSPMARALISKEEGDVVAVQAPGGNREVEILAVKYL